MSLIVMKFGGTSVGSAERIRQAASIVHQHDLMRTARHTIQNGERPLQQFGHLFKR